MTHITTVGKKPVINESQTTRLGGKHTTHWVDKNHVPSEIMEVMTFE